MILSGSGSPAGLRRDTPAWSGEERSMETVAEEKRRNIQMKVRIQKLSPSAILPVRGSGQAAGYDLCADLSESLLIAPGETIKVGTGLAAAIPEGYFGGIFARSGLSVKSGLRPANCTGVVDSDYRGELIVALHNDSDEMRTITPGERIAQLILLPYLAAEFVMVEELDKTARGTGGFGSTGTG